MASLLLLIAFVALATVAAKKVRSFAKTMLKDAARWAGAPRLSVRVSGALRAP